LPAYIDERGRRKSRESLLEIGELVNLRHLDASGNQEIDDAKRLSLLKQIQLELLRQVPAIPLPSPASNWYHNGKTMEIGFPIKAYMGTFILAKATSKR